MVDITPKTENGQAATDEDENEDEDDDEYEDQAESESTQICLYLGKNWRPGISADVYRAASDNWISEKLLRGSNHSVELSECPVAYRIPDGVRLESKGCVELGCRLSLYGKTLICRFQVHASRSRAPDVILGRPWAQKSGASALVSRRSDMSKDRNAQRRPATDPHGGLRRKNASSESVSGHRIMKLPQRHSIGRNAERSRR